MTTLHHLSQLLDQADCEFTIYDLGRRVTLIPNALFRAVEENRQPYPYPLRQHAQIAVVFRKQQEEAPFLWLLKFPLDERGLLKAAPVGDFIRYVAEAMGKQLTAPLTEDEQQALASNPYLFKPSEDKLAILHAKLRCELGQAPTHFYAAASEYFTAESDKTQWQQLGIQGLADIATRLNQDNNTTKIRAALAKLPDAPRYALLGCLEHVDLPASLAQRLADDLNLALSSTTADSQHIAALIRALAGAPKAMLQQQLQQLLQHPLVNVDDVLVAIAGRCWHGLDDDTLLAYLLKLAKNGNQGLFNALFADLVAIPALRCHILPLLHQPLPEKLQLALQEMQAGLQH
ncbi:DUF3549 family protein [Thaumasiovibrio subtropicus]|uniref:DUF3549 family protein n=1 Tax=Thaumasiovibrio subtropicus TaxID=1891207 RepID=UPI000B3559C6|nr:DUF3549 family protein [Thaumasiovibrio subtropicus]